MCSLLQVHREEQPRQTKVVVAVQMTYENMVELVIGKLKSHDLHLRPFPAVDEKVLVLYFYPVCRRKPSVSGEGGAGAEDSEFEL